MKKLCLILSLAYACTNHHSTPEIAVVPPPECREFTDLALHPNAPTEFPVEVLIHPATSNHHIGLILNAVDIWNTALGQEVLFTTITQDLMGMHGPCSFTTVATDVLVPDAYVGFTRSTACGAAHIEIETRSAHIHDGLAEYFTDQFVTQITVHELGHVLGLPHEDDPLSIMHPTIFGDQVISARSVCLVRLAILRSLIPQVIPDLPLEPVFPASRP